MSSPVRVYIETTVISYLTARPSKNPVQEGRRQVTLRWWDVRRKEFSTVISPLVVDEARQGDSEAARARLAALDGIPTLGLEESARDLAQALIAPGAIPTKAADDALHIALCVHAIPYLLTWNFRHIANATIRHRLNYICVIHGYNLPLICTPEEL
jgi:predicted nucleic acid-binding protein